MLSIVIGIIVLGLIHALIPNHWLPLVAVVRSDNWEKSKVLMVACITASAHVLGTTVLGAILGMVSSKMADQYGRYAHVVMPIFLILSGLIYLMINLPHGHHATSKDVQGYRKSKSKWIIFFIVIMFLSPCLEVQSLFIAAGLYGTDKILLLATEYALISITSIVTLVMLTLKGFQLINSQFIEHYEKRLTGMVLIIVGIIAFYIH